MNNAKGLLIQSGTAALAALCAAALLVSCTTTSNRDRGSLDDAMNKARDDAPGDRTVPDEPRYPDNGWPRSDDTPDSPPDNNIVFSADMNAAPIKGWVGYRGGKALAPDQHIETSFDNDVFLNFPATRRFDFSLYAGFKTANPVKDSSLDASVKKSLVFLKAGLEVRFSPFPDFKFMSPYVFAGLGGYYMGWDFRNPVHSGTDTIESDAVGGTVLTAGAGVYLLNLENFRLGINIMPENYLFGPTTQQGFDNDYFTYFNTVKVMGEISIRF